MILEEIAIGRLASGGLAGLSLGWLPMMELPFPLVVIGGLLLATISNRTVRRSDASSIAASSSQTASSAIASTPSPATSASASAQSIFQPPVGKPSTIRSQAPTLPTIKTPLAQPISPKISPAAAPADRRSSQRSDRPCVDQPHVNPSTETIPASDSADPQLPTFVAPQTQAPDSVSFKVGSTKHQPQDQ